MRAKTTKPTGQQLDNSRGAFPARPWIGLAEAGRDPEQREEKRVILPTRLRLAERVERGERHTADKVRRAERRQQAEPFTESPDGSLLNTVPENECTNYLCHCGYGAT